MDRRVLFVSYFFPPVGGAGVQRTTKFVKYLPSHDWIPSVLTVSNPSVPLLDESLLGDVPPSARVVRARTFEPGYAVKRAVAAANPRSNGPRWRHWPRRAARQAANLVLQPDPQILWWPAAVRAGTRLLGETPHDVIFASGPPFSSFLVAASISRRTGVPLVLDYRDEWDLSNRYWENKQFNRASLAVQRNMQDRVVRQARLLIATSRPSARALETIRERARSQAEVACVYNGFDPDDFTHQAGASSDERRFRLVYVGTLWNLTTVGPLVDAVERLSREHPQLVSQLELVFAGRRTPAEDERLARLRALPCRLTLLDYLDHSAATQLMRSAHRLCVLLADVPGAERVVPAKIFEYMAASRPILSIAPQGELSDLLARHPGTECVAPNASAICERLSVDLRRHAEGAAIDVSSVSLESSPYNRKRLASQLASLLNEVCGSERAGVEPARHPSLAAAGA